MSKKSSLGRGLDALLSRPGAVSEVPGLRAQSLSIERIVQAAYQPRQTFEPEALADLAASIREKGVLQPILVRPRAEDNAFEIVAGERRWRAAQLAGLSEIPAIVRDMSDREALEVAIVENLQREDLGPIEEARAYAALLERGLSQEEVAQAVGKGRSTVANALRLLSLPAAALEALEAGEISAGHARAILAQPEEDRDWALQTILRKKLTVREAEALRREPRPTNELVPRAHAHIERDLSRQIGAKVRIKGEDKGRLELSFHSREELDRLLELLGYQG